MIMRNPPIPTNRHMVLMGVVARCFLPVVIPCFIRHQNRVLQTIITGEAQSSRGDPKFGLQYSVAALGWNVPQISQRAVFFLNYTIIPPESRNLPGHFQVSALRPFVWWSWPRRRAAKAAAASWRPRAVAGNSDRRWWEMVGGAKAAKVWAVGTYPLVTHRTKTMENHYFSWVNSL